MAQYRTAAGQQEYPRKPPILWTDYFMLAVAAVSAALIGWVDLFPVPGGPGLGAIVIADYATCGIFALEFLWRWRREDWSWNFPFVYGVRHIGLQRSGTLSKTRREHERTRAFRRMRNWRIDVEARISHLERGFGLRRSRMRRLTGARTWIGLGIFAYNLQRMTVITR